MDTQGQTKSSNLSLTDDVSARLRLASVTQRRSRSAIVTEILDRELPDFEVTEIAKKAAPEAARRKKSAR